MAFVYFPAALMGTGEFHHNVEVEDERYRRLRGALRSGRDAAQHGLGD